MEIVSEEKCIQSSQKLNVHICLRASNSNSVSNNDNQFHRFTAKKKKKKYVHFKDVLNILHFDHLRVYFCNIHANSTFDHQTTMIHQWCGEKNYKYTYQFVELYRKKKKQRLIVKGNNSNETKRKKKY